MKDLARLLKRLESIKLRRDAEKRINGESKKYKDLHQQYLDCLKNVASATEK